MGTFVTFYLAVYCPETIGGFGLEEKSKTKSSLRSRKNKLLQFVECVTPIIDPQ